MMDWATLADRVAAPKRDDSSAAAQEQAMYRSANADVIGG